ncbi:MAG: cytidine deaminase [Alphaproteobacteria bacterium]|nr:cytidine deaminase [Alphaproteobacteria bacterium]
MAKPALTRTDRALIKAAEGLIRDRYAEGRHHIAAAVRLKDGTIHTGLHIDTYVGRASVCAEAVAIGTALGSGPGKITTVVSVRHPRPREKNQVIHVVSPCGNCRELLADFAPDCSVILDRDGHLSRVPIKDLLPYKYVRRP